MSYVNKKNKTAAEIGMLPRLELFPATVTREELFAKIDALNADANVHGILVQAPLPKHLDEIETLRRRLSARDEPL